MFDIKEVVETVERLQAYPKLLSKVKTLLDLIEKKQVESIDDFEEALIPEGRGFGKDIMETWATHAEGSLRDRLLKNFK